jgi:hypothetical protein
MIIFDTSAPLIFFAQDQEQNRSENLLNKQAVP